MKRTCFVLSLIMLVFSSCYQTTGIPPVILLPFSESAEFEVQFANPAFAPSEAVLPEVVSVESGNSLETPGNPVSSDDDWTFLGWSTDSSTYELCEFPITIEEDIVLYAVWAKKTITPAELDSISDGLALMYDSTKNGYMLTRMSSFDFET